MIFVSGPCLHPIRLRQAANRGQSQAKIPSACPPNSPSRRNRARASGTGIAHGQRAAHRAHAGHRQLLRVLRLARRAHGGTGDHTPATPPHSAARPGDAQPVRGGTKPGARRSPAQAGPGTRDVPGTSRDSPAMSLQMQSPGADQACPTQVSARPRHVRDP